MQSKSTMFHQPVFRFPVELERIIFETALTQHRCVQLTRVALRVKSWLEPLIYAHVVLPPDDDLTVELFLRTLHSRPASFFTIMVKSLTISRSVTYYDAAAILNKCRGVRNIMCWFLNWTMIVQCFCPSLDDIRPTHFVAADITAGTIRTHVPFFRNVTHLGAIGVATQAVRGDTTISLWNVLHHLPSLTHFSCTVSSVTFFESDCTIALSKMLAKCSSVRLFWILIISDTDIVVGLSNLLITDPRLVVQHVLGDIRNLGSFQYKAADLFWNNAERIAMEHSLG